MINLQEILKGIKPYVLGWIAGLLSDWKDYSDLSTIVGWSAFTTKKIRYKKAGKLIFIKFTLVGTGDTTDYPSFSLPYGAAADGEDGYFMTRSMDNVTWSISIGNIGSGSSYITFYKDAAGSPYTDNVGRAVQGQFWYQAAS